MSPFRHMIQQSSQTSSQEAPCFIYDRRSIPHAARGSEGAMARFNKVLRSPCCKLSGVIHIEHRLGRASKPILKRLGLVCVSPYVTGDIVRLSRPARRVDHHDAFGTHVVRVKCTGEELFENKSMGAFRPYRRAKQHTPIADILSILSRRQI